MDLKICNNHMQIPKKYLWISKQSHTRKWKKKKKIFFKLMNEPKHFINALQSMKLRQFNK